MNKVLPVANELDPQHGLIPDALRDEMGELGFFGILIPEQYGGLGLGVFEYALITEELARAWMSVASIIARAGLVAGLDPSQRAKYLPLAARGKWLGAFAMSEPDAGSDIASIRTRAEKTDGGWKIYDVNVLGIWLADQYRNSFAQEINAKGIDGLIKSLAERNARPAPAASAAKKG